MRYQVTGLVAVALVLAGCSGQAGPADADADTNGGGSEPTTLRLAVTSAPQGGWDPAVWTWDGYTPIQEAAYDGLLRSTSEGIAPGLAEEWSWESATELSMTLREGVTFENGDALTSDVVKGNLERFLESTNRVVGQLAPLEEVVVHSDTEFTLQMSEPIPDLEILLSENAGFMVSPDAVADPSILQAAPHGIAPYDLDEAATVADVTYVFHKNPDFWDADNVSFDNVTIEVQEDRSASFNALQAGQIDLIYGISTNVDAAEAAGIAVAPRPGTMLAMTVNDYQGKRSPELGDLRVRQAMNYAVDREAIADLVAGEAAYQMYPEKSEAHDPALDEDYSYDPEKARELLEEAGYGDGLQLTVHALTEVVPAATAIASYFGEVGIELEVNALPVQEFLNEVLSGNAVLILTTNLINTAYADLSASYRVPGGRNPLENEIPEITELLDLAQYEEDPDVRVEHFQDIAAIISEQAIGVPVAQEQRFFMHSENVENIQLPHDYIMPTLRELKPATP